MSNQGTPQNPYSQQTQGVPAGYPQPQRNTTIDRGVLRQVMFGAAVVLGIAVVTNILSTIGNAVFGLAGEQIFGLVWNVFIALVFIAGAGLSALYIAPFARATSTQDLVRRLAVAAAIGAAALLVLNFIWSVANGGQYLAQMIISSGVLGSISTGLTYGAFFALGVFLARALPAAPGPMAYPAQPQGYAAPVQAQGQPVQHAHPAQQAYVQPQAQTYVQPQGPGAAYGQPPAQPQQPLPPQR